MDSVWVGKCMRKWELCVEVLAHILQPYHVPWSFKRSWHWFMAKITHSPQAFGSADLRWSGTRTQNKNAGRPTHFSVSRCLFVFGGEWGFHHSGNLHLHFNQNVSVSVQAFLCLTVAQCDDHRARLINYQGVGTQPPEMGWGKGNQQQGTACIVAFLITLGQKELSHDCQFVGKKVIDWNHALKNTTQMSIFARIPIHFFCS